MTTITSVEFKRYKGFGQYSVSLQKLNILVGPNNCGKSTIIGAFKVLAAGLRKARNKRPDATIKIDQRSCLAYSIPQLMLGVSTENVHTNYDDIDSSVTFRLSNDNKLKLYFPEDGGSYLVCESAKGTYVSTPTIFKKEFPITVSSPPVIGPVEHEEEILEEATIRSDLGTNRASRHFRNFWHHYPEGFDEFAKLVKETWPGMEVTLPTRAARMSNKLVMWNLENRITRELFWSGYGFQIWCQLLTHISRSRNDTILLIDEPEVYLHPDVQRQLLAILRDIGPDIVIATHSTEIMAEADPSEILLVDKSKKSTKRLKDVKQVQHALDSIGSIQNITLTNLARNKRLLFVEGLYDFTVIRMFARKLGFLTLSLGNDITAIESGGFSSAERIGAFAWGFKLTADTLPNIAAIFDRDFFCSAELAKVQEKLAGSISMCHIHERKEIENYLLEIEPLQNCLNKAVHDRASRTHQPTPEVVSVRDLLTELSAPLRVPAQSQYTAKVVDYRVHDGTNRATLHEEALRLFETKWNDIDTRMEIVQGSELLRLLRTAIQDKYGVTLTDAKIVDGFTPEKVPNDMKLLCQRLDTWRSRK